MAAHVLSASASLCQLASDWRGTMPADGMVVEEKIDGFRAVYLPDHTGRKRLFTRNGMPIEGVDHILWRLAQIERAAGQSVVIDGEFQVEGTLAATKAWFERGWKGGGVAGRFYAFDILPYEQWERGGWDRPLVERKAWLVELEAAARADTWEWRPGSHGSDDADAVTVLPDGWTFDTSDVVDEARRVWAAKGEGVMLKDAAAPYQRRRCAAWLKVKAENSHLWSKAAA